MPTRLLVASFTVLIILTLTPPARAADCPRVSVCFTPGENCTQTIVQALNAAQRSIQAQAYSFTSAPIAKALLDAHKRGVQVQVILDKVRHEAWQWNERISPPPVQADGEPLGRSVRGMHPGGETAGPERYR